jgi:hypothetical protein
VLSNPPAGKMDGSKSKFEDLNVQEMHDTLLSTLRECRESNSLDITPDLLSTDSWSDELDCVYAVILLTATSSESFDYMLRPLLSSRHAVVHISNMINICRSLLKPIVDSFVRAIDRHSSSSAEGAVEQSKIAISWLYSSILIELAEMQFARGDSSYALLIRDILTSQKHLPAVCIDITSRFQLNLCMFISEQIPSSPERHKSHSGRPDKDPPSLTNPTVELSKLWIFQQLDAAVIRSSLHAVLKAFGELLEGSIINTDTAGYGNDRSKSTRDGSCFSNDIRAMGKVCCAMISVLHQRVSSSKGSDAASSLSVIDDETEKCILYIVSQLLKLLQESYINPPIVMPRMPPAEVALCVRVTIPLLLCCLISHRSNLGQQHATSASSSSDMSAFSTALIKVLSFPTAMGIAHPDAIHEPHSDLIAYCFLMKCAFSFNRIIAVRDVVSKELSLQHAAEFIPQGSFLFIAQTISAASVPVNAVLSGTLPDNEQVKQLQGISGGWRLRLIERNKDTILHEFQGLRVPSEISAFHEFPGDWMYALHLLMRCHIITTARASGESEDAVSFSAGSDGSSRKSLRTIMNLVLQRVSFPPHSLLLEAIDSWLEITANGTGLDEGSGSGGQSMPPPSLADASSVSSSVSNGSGRDTVPFLPSDIRLLTAVLEGFVSPCLTRLCQQLQFTEPCAVGGNAILGNSSRQCIKGVVMSYGEFDANITHHAISSPDAMPVSLLTESELLNMSISLTGESTSYTSSQSNMHECLAEFGSKAFRAAVACYASLRYQVGCLRSARASYTCVLFCEPHDLPLKRCVSTFLLAVGYLSNDCAKMVPVPYPSQCVDNFLSSFIQLLRRSCPEVLLRERMYGLLASAQYGRFFQETEHEAHPCSSPPSTDVLLDILRYPSQETIVMNLLTESSRNITGGCFSMTGTVLDMLRSAINHMSSPTYNDTSDIGHLQTMSRSVFNIWKITHALHPRASYLELDTFNCLLEMGDVRRPRGIASYSILIHEPILLFRLPVKMLRIPLVMKIVLFMLRSLLIASRVEARESLTTIQLKAKDAHKGYLMPSAGSRSLLEAHIQIDPSEYSTLQEVICVRLIFELWNSFFNKKSNGDGCHSADIAELGNVLVVHISQMLSENAPLLDVLLFYGIRYWSCFMLLSQSEDIMHAVTSSLLQFMNTAVDQHIKTDTPSPLWSTKTVELLLLHMSFLVRSISLSKPSRDLVQALSGTVEAFYYFIKKSSKQACWKQPASQSNLGTLFSEVLQILAIDYPQVSLRIITCFTKPDLIQGCPTSSTMVDMQSRLKGLHTKICQNAVPLTVQKRLRSSSELSRDNDDRWSGSVVVVSAAMQEREGNADRQFQSLSEGQMSGDALYAGKKDKKARTS